MALKVFKLQVFVPTQAICKGSHGGQGQGQWGEATTPAREGATGRTQWVGLYNPLQEGRVNNWKQ